MKNDLPSILREIPEAWVQENVNTHSSEQQSSSWLPTSHIGTLLLSLGTFLRMYGCLEILCRHLFESALISAGIDFNTNFSRN